MKQNVARVALLATTIGIAVGAAPPAVAGAYVRPGAIAAVSLESAASKATKVARTVAMSVIAVAFAAAAVMLAFRRDFKDAVGVFAVGVVAVLFASPAGMSLIRSTVSSLFG